MEENNKLKNVNNKKQKWIKIIVVVLWLAVIALLLLNKDEFTIENIVNHSPNNVAQIVLLILLLFAAKSMTVVFYSGIISASAGLLLPPYLSIPTVIVGIIIMDTIPFFVGRFLGAGEAERIILKYPKLTNIHEFRKQNDGIFSFLVRMTGMVASDAFSAYMGASNAKYLPYIVGSVIGELPISILLVLVGENVENIKSPWLVVLLVLKIIAVVLSVTVFAKKLKSKKAEDGKQPESNT